MLFLESRVLIRRNISNQQSKIKVVNEFNENGLNKKKLTFNLSL